ncbi:MAG: hypothetical protein M3137_12235 [Actinomycetota bacterium]|nr:hypothetical protein [Actinomycetota bacterium]
MAVMPRVADERAAADAIRQHGAAMIESALPSSADRSEPTQVAPES